MRPKLKKAHTSKRAHVLSTAYVYHDIALYELLCWFVDESVRHKTWRDEAY